MASERRIEKLNIFFRDEIARIIDREVEFLENALVTVTLVSVSPDMHYADVFISVLGGNDKEALEILQKNVYNIQQILNRKVRMRPVPKIRFMLNENEVRRETVEKSLAELKRKGEV